MMRNECNIIRDILPLYAENMVSGDTADLVEEHLKDCDACRKEYENTKEIQPEREVTDAAPLLKLSRKMKIKKIQTIILTVVFALTLFVSAFAALDAPKYFLYSENLVTVEPVDGGGLQITFDRAVTDFDCQFYLDSEGGNYYYCAIQAWTSTWDELFSSDKGNLSTTVFPEKNYPVVALYISHGDAENVCVYGDMGTAGTCIILPRLALNGYLILAIAAFVAVFVVWLITRKKAKIRVWVERIGMYPIAYIISHCFVCFVSEAVYSLPRSFLFIVAISVLLYGAMLLVYNILRLKKEIRETNDLNIY